MQLMTREELEQIEIRFPGIFTTPGIGINYENVEASDRPELSYLHFCCDFPVPYKYAKDGEHLVAVCLRCGEVNVCHASDDDGVEPFSVLFPSLTYGDDDVCKME